MALWACNLSIQKVQGGGSRVQGHYQLHTNEKPAWAKVLSQVTKQNKVLKYFNVLISTVYCVYCGVKHVSEIRLFWTSSKGARDQSLTHSFTVQNGSELPSEHVPHIEKFSSWIPS